MSRFFNYYLNIIDDNIVDLTTFQFSPEIHYRDYKIIKRKVMLIKDTNNKYQRRKK